MFKRIMVALTTVLLSAALMLTPGLVATANAAPVVAANYSADQCKMAARDYGQAIANRQKSQKRFANAKKKVKQKKANRKKARQRVKRANKRFKRAKKRVHKAVHKRVAKQNRKQARKNLKRAKKNLNRKRNAVKTWKVRRKTHRQNVTARKKVENERAVRAAQVCKDSGAFEGLPAGADALGNLPILGDILNGFFEAFGGFSGGNFDPSMLMDMFDPSMLTDLFGSLFDMGGGDFPGADMFDPSILFDLFGSFADFGSMDPSDLFGGFTDMFDPAMLMDFFSIFGDMGGFDGLDPGMFMDMFDPAMLMDLFGSFGEFGDFADMFGGFGDLGALLGGTDFGDMFNMGDMFDFGDMMNPEQFLGIFADMFDQFGGMGGFMDNSGGLLRMIPVIGDMACDSGLGAIPFLGDILC